MATYCSGRGCVSEHLNAIHDVSRKRSMTVQEARSKILDSSDSEFLTSCSDISTGSRLSAVDCRLVALMSFDFFARVFIHTLLSRAYLCIS